MKNFSANESYERIYLYKGSKLIRGTIQDNELRRAWHLAMFELLRYLYVEVDDSATETEEKLQENAAKLGRLFEELRAFVITNTTPEERKDR